ncbi:binding-protein-dependent transport system inner membrane component, partial [mine drainage metagenome]
LTINFVLPRLMPGNPAIAMMARFRGRVNGQVLHALEIAFGVNTRQSEIAQYFSYLGDTLTGHLGVSLTFFPNTVLQVVRSDAHAGVEWTSPLPLRHMRLSGRSLGEGVVARAGPRHEGV